MVNKAGVDYYEGHASFISATKILITHNENKQFIEGNRILIATGSYPIELNVEGGHLCYDSNRIFEMEKLPESMLVNGSGYIGVEMAQIMNAFGVKTTIIARSDILRGRIDDDIRNIWKFNAERLGLTIKTGVSIIKVQKCEKEEIFKA